MPTTKRKKSSTSVEQNEHSTTAVYQVRHGRFVGLFGGNMLAQVVVTGGFALAGFAGWNVNSFTGGWVRQAHANTAGQLLYNVDAAALRAVSAVEQSYMGTLRHREAAVGTGQQRRAKELALKQLKASLGPKGLKALREAVGGDLDMILDSSIEAAVYELKAGQLGMRPVMPLPLFPVQPSSLEDGRGRRPLSRSSL